MPKNNASQLLDALDKELESGKITESEWYSRVAQVITPAYLAGGNERAESGYSGDASQWEQARSLVLEAVDRDGSFLDIGCANGLLMESLESWGKARGRNLELHGMDIAPELVELSARRLPRFADRLHVGNAFHWVGPKKYGFVRAGLEYVPGRKRREYVSHLLSKVVEPGGRLIVGVYNEESEEYKAGSFISEILAGMGFKVAGSFERPHRSDKRLRYKVLWIKN